MLLVAVMITLGQQDLPKLQPP